MSMNPLRLAVAGAAVGGGLVFGAGPAGAQACYPPGPNCVVNPGASVRVSATVVTPGRTISITVSGFKPATTGRIVIASVEQQLSEFTTNSTGTATTSATIPADISIGRHTIFARGTAPDGSPAETSQGITVAAAAASGGIKRSQLARTGAVVVPTTLAGLGLVGGGIALQRSSRRSKASQSTA